MGFRARVVENNEPPLPVEGQRCSPEKMVQPHHPRLEPLIRAKPIDAIAVLLAEEEVLALRIEREAAEPGLSRLNRERHHDAGRPRGVYRQGAPEVNAIDFGGGIASPAVAQDHESAPGVEGELDRAGNSGDHYLHAKSRRDVRAVR